MKWQTIVDALKASFGVMKSSIVSAVMKAAGLAGGFYSWILGLIVNFYGQKAIDGADTAAHLADQANVDEKINEQYQEAIKDDNTPEQTLIDLETDILNGGRKP